MTRTKRYSVLVRPGTSISRGGSPWHLVFRVDFLDGEEVYIFGLEIQYTIGSD